MSRFILLTEFFPPQAGGIEDSLRRSMTIFGSDLTVVAPPMLGAIEFDQRQPYPVLRRSLFSGRGKPAWWWLVGWLVRQRSRVRLVMFGHYSSAVSAGWIARWFGMPYAVYVHGHDLLSELEKPGRRIQVKRNLQRANWVGVNSTFMADHVHRLGVAWSKIVRLHPMVEDAVLDGPVASPVGQRLVTACRLVPRKNIDTVLRAVAKLLPEFPNLHYDVIGDGPERNHLESLALKLGLTANVTFHGRIGENIKWEILRKSSLGVMVPTVTGSQVEGFGLFFLEASASGLPVVGSQGGGVADAVLDGRTGKLVPALDTDVLAATVRDFLQHEPARLQFGQAGREMVRQEFLQSVRLQRLRALTQRQRQPNPALVSVVIPAFQSATTITDTLEDVFSQTWPRLEVIVVDDGSTDDLGQAIEPYRQRLTCVTQSNHGAAAARNTGADRAHGEYLLFLDADMRLDPGLITSMMVTLQTHPQAAYAYCNFQFGPKGFRLFEFNDDQLRRRNFIHTTSLLRRSAFPRFDPSLKKFQDWDLWLTMLAQGKRGLWIPRQLFRVQQRAGGYSTWLPRFVYRLPGIGQGQGSATVAKYRQAEAIIRAKHHLG